MLSARLNRKVARLNYSHSGAGCKVKVYHHHRTIVHGHKHIVRSQASSVCTSTCASWKLELQLQLGVAAFTSRETLPGSCFALSIIVSATFAFGCKHQGGKLFGACLLSSGCGRVCLGKVCNMWANLGAGLILASLSLAFSSDNSPSSQ